MVKKDDIIMKMKVEMEARHKAKTEAEDSIEYPLNEFPNYNIVDIIMMLRRHKNKKITNEFIKK